LEICFNFPLFFLPKDSQLEDERVSWSDLWPPVAEA
jgi:hypothetical protein